MTDKNGQPLQIGDKVLVAGRHKNYLLRNYIASIVAIQPGSLAVIAMTAFEGKPIKLYLRPRRLVKVNA